MATGMPEIPLRTSPSSRKDGKRKSLREFSQSPPTRRPANAASALLGSSSSAAEASVPLPKPGVAPQHASPECMTPLQGHSSASKAGPSRGAGTPQDPIEFSESDEEHRINGAGAAAALAAAAEESAGHDGDDTPRMHHARAWQAAAEASSQPAAVSPPEDGAARNAEAAAGIAADMETASESDYGSAEGSVSQEIGPAPARAKPSSAAPDSSGPPQGQGSSQVPSLTMPMLSCSVLCYTSTMTTAWYSMLATHSFSRCCPGYMSGMPTICTSPSSPLPTDTSDTPGQRHCSLLGYIHDICPCKDHDILSLRVEVAFLPVFSPGRPHPSCAEGARTGYHGSPPHPRGGGALAERLPAAQITAQQLDKVAILLAHQTR